MNIISRICGFNQGKLDITVMRFMVIVIKRWTHIWGAGLHQMEFVFILAETRTNISEITTSIWGGYSFLGRILRKTKSQ